MINQWFIILYLHYDTGAISAVSMPKCGEFKSESEESGSQPPATAALASSNHQVCAHRIDGGPTQQLRRAPASAGQGWGRTPSLGGVPKPGE